MSFDLYVLDLEAGAGVDAVQELLDDDTGTLTARLASLVSELEQRFPGLDDDPDASPWASWPLEQPVGGGRGCAFNITWSAAEATTEALIEAASRHQLTIYDPQTDLLVPPSDVRVGSGGRHAAAPRKRWWRR
jgi:hypothetical protein